MTFYIAFWDKAVSDWLKYEKQIFAETKGTIRSGNQPFNTLMGLLYSPKKETQHVKNYNLLQIFNIILNTEIRITLH